jgi:hypothetical protein
MTNISCKNKRLLNSGELGTIDMSSLSKNKLMDDLGTVDQSFNGKLEQQLGTINMDGKNNKGEINLGTIDNPTVPYKTPEIGSLGVGVDKC